MEMNGSIMYTRKSESGVREYEINRPFIFSNQKFFLRGDNKNLEKFSSGGNHEKSKIAGLFGFDG